MATNIQKQAFSSRATILTFLFSVLVFLSSPIQNVCAWPTSTAPATGTVLQKLNDTVNLVMTEGTNFVLNGKPWTFAGTNIPWLADQNASLIYETVNNVHQDGYLVMRLWAFRDWVVGVQPKPAFYYQSFVNGTANINWGPDGLQKLDQVVHAAEMMDVKIIFTLVNNWPDYGGMDDYIIAAGKQKRHSLFYQDPDIIQMFKNYINVIVTRYKGSKAIMAWELANEARCLGSSPGFDLMPPTCHADLITSWADQISTYIKSIDPNHLVSFGGEGMFNNPGATTYEYNGGSGQDFTAELSLNNIDFGTMHVYLTPPYMGPEWAAQYIMDHCVVAAKINKPIIMEEYNYLKNQTNPTRWQLFNMWHNFILGDVPIQGDMVWAFADKTFNESFGPSATLADILPSDPDYNALVPDWAKQMNAKASRLTLSQ